MTDAVAILGFALIVCAAIAGAYFLAVAGFPWLALVVLLIAGCTRIKTGDSK